MSSKTHFATVERANESDNNDYWSETLCGLEYTESPLSDNIKNVTCKKCLKIYPNYKNQMEEIIKNGDIMYGIKFDS